MQNFLSAIKTAKDLGSDNEEEKTSKKSIVLPAKSVNPNIMQSIALRFLKLKKEQEVEEEEEVICVSNVIKNFNLTRDPLALSKQVVNMVYAAFKKNERLKMKGMTTINVVDLISKNIRLSKRRALMIKLTKMKASDSKFKDKDSWVFGAPEEDVKRLFGKALVEVMLQNFDKEHIESIISCNNLFTKNNLLKVAAVHMQADTKYELEDPLAGSVHLGTLEEVMSENNDLKFEDSNKQNSECSINKKLIQTKDSNAILIPASLQSRNSSKHIGKKSMFFEIEKNEGEKSESGNKSCRFTTKLNTDNMKELEVQDLHLYPQNFKDERKISSSYQDLTQESERKNCIEVDPDLDDNTNSSIRKLQLDKQSHSTFDLYMKNIKDRYFVGKSAIITKKNKRTLSNVNFITAKLNDSSNMQDKVKRLYIKQADFQEVNQKDQLIGKLVNNMKANKTELNRKPSIEKNKSFYLKQDSDHKRKVSYPNSTNNIDHIDYQKNSKMCFSGVNLLPSEINKSSNALRGMNKSFMYNSCDFRDEMNPLSSFRDVLHKNSYVKRDSIQLEQMLKPDQIVWNLHPSKKSTNNTTKHLVRYSIGANLNHSSFDGNVGKTDENGSLGKIQNNFFLKNKYIIQEEKAQNNFTKLKKENVNTSLPNDKILQSLETSKFHNIESPPKIAVRRSSSNLTRANQSPAAINKHKKLINIGAITNNFSPLELKACLIKSNFTSKEKFLNLHTNKKMVSKSFIGSQELVSLDSTKFTLNKNFKIAPPNRNRTAINSYATLKITKGKSFNTKKEYKQ